MFTTGTPYEGAVNYTDPLAVCGTGWVPALEQNRDNLFLPKDGACAQPIGPKWVANVTKFFAYAFDTAGLAFGAPNVCQDPSLLWRSIVNAARWNVPPCLSELTAAGTPPAGGKPKAYFDDTAGEKILYVWDCTEADYVAIGVNAEPCSAPDVGSSIPSGSKMLICDGSTLKRADIAAAGMMKVVGYRVCAGITSTPTPIENVGPLPLSGYLNNVNPNLSAPPNAPVLQVWDNAKLHLAHFRGPDPAGGAPTPTIDQWVVFAAGSQPMASSGQNFAVFYELA